MKAELITKLEELLQQEASAVANQMRTLQKEYQKLWTTEFEKAKQEFIDDGGKAKEFEYPKTPDDLAIAKLFDGFEKKKKDEDSRLATEQNKNFEIRKEIIAKINDLSEVSSNVGTAVKKLIELQAQWKATGAVSSHKYKELQADYSKAIEGFNYKLNIVKELQEHDLKRNFELKTELLQKLKGVVAIENIKEAERVIKIYRNDWEDIGPVPNDKWDVIKTEYRQTLDEVYSKIKSHYNAIEEKKENNLHSKKDLITRIHAIANESANANVRKWNELTHKIIEIQNEWKSVGRTTLKDNDAVWTEFRKACDDFFEKKKAVFSVFHEQQGEVKKIKQDFIAKAEALSTSTDWQKTSQDLMKLQDDWKKHTMLNEKEESKFFFQFRKACNAFFDAKKTHFESINSSYESNATKKEEILAQLNAFTPTGDAKDTLVQLKQFTSDWNAAGLVPFKDKKRLNDAFYNALDNLYEKLNISKAEKILFQFKTKLERLVSQENGMELLQREADFLKKQMDEVNGSIKKYENNMSFFKNAKSDNPLFKEVNENIANEKQKLADFTGKRKLVTEEMSKLREAAKEVVKTEVQPA